MKVSIFFKTIFLSLLLISNFTFCQLAGTLDISFNGTGYKFLTNILATPTDEVFIHKTTLLQSDGKIILAGYFGLDSSSNLPDNEKKRFFAIRLNADTSLDTSFGTNGLVTISIPIVCQQCNGLSSSQFNNIMTIQPDGKIIMISDYWYNSNGNSNVAAIRLNTSGTLDTSFGNNGIAIINAGFLDNVPTTVTVQLDNKILIAGAYGNSAPMGRILRLLPNGAIDNSFGTNGVTADINCTNGLQSIFTTIDIQADGKIVGSGQYIISGSLTFFTARYNIDGSLDSSFGTNGLVIITNSVGYAQDQIIQPDGKILTIGAGEGITLVRLNSDGSMDDSFGPPNNPGIVNNMLNGYNSAGYNILLQTDNKIVLVGWFIDAIIARLNQDGTPDMTFNSVGYTISNYPSVGIEQYNSVIQLSDGKFLVAGKTSFPLNGVGYGRITLTKYNSGLNLSNTTFNKDLIKISPNPTQNKGTFDNSINQFITADIYNYLGQQVGNQKLSVINNQEIDLSNYSSGVYVLKLSNDNESVSVKVIKE